jgi:hypothetical protein
MPRTQNELNEAFEVKGKFYTSPAGFECRSELQIRRPHLRGETRPDAVVVMMNPGGSIPLERAAANSLVCTRPDTTQFQIMRVMDMVPWSIVTVLNLSDLREGSSSQLVGRVQCYETREGHGRHSIFARERRDELQSVIDGVPTVIAAWGVHPRLRALAQQALKALSDHEIVGLQKAADWRFYHPLPRNAAAQTAWVSAMHKLLVDRA